MVCNSLSLYCYILPSRTNDGNNRRELFIACLIYSWIHWWILIYKSYCRIPKWFFYLYICNLLQITFVKNMNFTAIFFPILMKSVKQISSKPFSVFKMSCYIWNTFFNCIVITICEKEPDEQLNQGAKLLKEISENLGVDKLRNNRTNWINYLNGLEANETIYIAEAMVDLCYNYTIEESISNVSRIALTIPFSFIFTVVAKKLSSFVPIICSTRQNITI